MNFASRTNWDLTENELTIATREARAAGRVLFDLTVSNPTACGFQYSPDALLHPLSSPEALRYEPEPFGMLHTRETVAGYYRDLDADTRPERICLTTSTSEAYSFLFRLLCETGDELLIARPSYPLFDFIARLDDVRLVEYPLLYDHGWHIDRHSLQSAVTPRTRALVVVHPNNPTGNFASAEERAWLDDFCAEHDLALIVDEVFLDYALPGVRQPSFACGNCKALTFILSGISKVCALPQMKLSWMVTKGPEDIVREALKRLEVIADTFLSVNAPTQHALPNWLAGRGVMQQQILDRVQENLHSLDLRLQGSQADRLEMQGGWTVVLRVPRYVDGNEFSQAALQRGVIVQPGEFYGLSEGHIVLSLLTTPDVWRQGIVLLPVD